MDQTPSPANSMPEKIGDEGNDTPLTPSLAQDVSAAEMNKEITRDPMSMS